MCKISLNKALEIYHWALSAHQTFTMCHNDSISIKDGKRVAYVIDGYDLTRYIFPKELFRGKPNPHHDAIKLSWDTFFSESTADLAYAVLSPFALIEILATIKENSYSDKEFSEILQINKDEITFLEKILIQNINEINKDELTQKEIVKTLHSFISQTVKSQNIILRGDWFNKMNELKNKNQLELLDPLLKKIDSLQIKELLKYDINKIERASNYLNDKRKGMFSENNRLYNTLDIYHYILVDNIEKPFNSKNINIFLTSSGILSRNSWLLIKYGKFPTVISHIPNDWAARNSNSPAYLFKAANHFSKDFNQTGDFFNEGKIISKIVVREMEKIPEVNSCIFSYSERQRYQSQNPEIKFNNNIAQYLALFETEFYKLVNPESHTESLVTISDKIDIENLLEIIKNKNNLVTESQNVFKSVQENLIKFNTESISWDSYIAPLGDAAYDILKTFNQNIDI